MNFGHGMQLGNHHNTSGQRPVLSLKSPSGPLHSVHFLHPCPKQTLICSLLLVLPFLEFHINGIIEHMIICVRLLSVNIEILKFICVVVCISIAFLLMAE